MIQFDIITIFPKVFESYFNETILKRAQKKKLIKIKIHNLRDNTTDKHKKYFREKQLHKKRWSCDTLSGASLRLYAGNE